MTTRGARTLAPSAPTDRTRPSDARRKVQFALTVIQDALATIERWAGHLPEWTDNHTAPDRTVCGSSVTHVIENGTQRWSQYDPESHQAWSGSDTDYFVDASTDYIRCEGCGQLFRLPDDFEWEC